jgi:hypothetical protein
VNWEQAADSIAALQVMERFLLERNRKGKNRVVDLKAFVTKLELHENGRLLLDLYHPCAEAGIGPRDTLAALFGLKEEQAELIRIVKKSAREAAASG